MTLPALASSQEAPNGHVPTLDPRLRALLIAIRRALLILADGIGEYCELQKA